MSSGLEAKTSLAQQETAKMSKTTDTLLLAELNDFKYSAQLEAALADVCPSEDPLDSADFDPIAFINAKFPDERSMGNGQLQLYNDQLSKQTKELSDTLTDQVRQHSVNQKRTKESIEKATGAIQQLFNKIKAIKEKATQSETMVQDICSDIKSLDYARGHLSKTIAALANHMMIASMVDQMEHYDVSKAYDMMPATISSISSMFMKLKECLDVPKVKTLYDRVQRVKQQVGEDILNAFDLAIPKITSSETENEKFRSMCLVVDELDESVKSSLLKSAFQKLMIPYDRGYASGAEGGTIEHTERRYGWLRRQLREFNKNEGQMFPKEWQMNAVFCFKFCLRTRDHLAIILPDEKQGGVLSTESLIQSLQKTKEFEEEMNRKHGGKHILNVDFQKVDAKARGKRITKINTAVAIQQKYEKKRQKNNKTTQQQLQEQQQEEAQGFVVSKYVFDFSEFISPCFNNFMSGYVDLEKTNLAEVLAKNDREEKWYPWEADGMTPDESMTYSGSDNLFLYIRTSLARCSKLTAGKILFDIFCEYRQAVGNYSKDLSARVRKHEGKILSGKDVQSMCVMMTTAEYCAEVCTSLESGAKEIVDAKFHEQISMERVQDKFYALRTLALTTLINSFKLQVSKAFVSMTKRQWNLVQSVGDHSDYVTNIGDILKAEIPLVVPLLSSRLISLFNNKLAESLIATGIDSLFKCRRVGTNGARQLTLDFVSLGMMILTIPQIGGAAKTRLSRIYERFVNKRMARVDGILKPLAGPPEYLIATFKAVSHKKHIDDLAAIMTMGGLKKSEQVSLVNAYNASHPKAERVSPKLVEEKGVRNIFKSIVF